LHFYITPGLKKITALFFLILFLFNLFGYRIVVDYIQQRVNEQLEARLDNNAYDESQLVEVKIALHLPYQTSSSYERYNGEVEINGLLYKYVKRKVNNDTLYLMCIANTKKMHLETAKDDFFKISNDLVQNSSSKRPGSSKSTFKNFPSEYDGYSFVSNAGGLVCCQQNLWLPILPQNLLSSPHTSPEQPPELTKA
jgi:hypothetical protein